MIIKNLTIAWPYKALDFVIYTQIVQPEELTTKFILDIKQVMRACGVSYHSWLNFMMNLYRDYPGIIVDQSMNEVFLATARNFEQTPDSISYWFRDALMPSRINPKALRKESVERWVILATILKAWMPEEAQNWGK